MANTDPSFTALDRNVALVGRVLKGVELLSGLPRGHGEMGFYVAPEPVVPILAYASPVIAGAAEPFQSMTLESI